jgi:hypothetical protein
MSLTTILSSLDPAIAPIKKAIYGLFSSFLLFIAGISLENVNKLLTTVSMLLGISIAAVTLYRIFGHKDTQGIIETQEKMQRQLDRIEGRCNSRSFCGFQQKNKNEKIS